MSHNPAALSPQDAARALLWLAEMGADEFLADAPQDRFAEKPPSRPLPAAEAAPAPTPVARKPVPPSGPPPAPVDVSFEAIHAEARSAPDMARLIQVLDGFDTHPLRRSASNTCFVAGPSQPRVLLISDRPRSEEDRSGKVLADRHELLAERMLAAITLRALEQGEREQVALLSFMPWRPPGNRPPTDVECRLVLPFAERAIALLKPKLILCLGSLPGQWLAQAPESIQRQRGRWMEFAGIPALSTFHPETLLKSPASKRLAWADLLAFRAKLDSLS